MEHLAGTLTIRGGNDGSVQIDEPILLEEVVSVKGQFVPYPHNGAYAESLCPEMQVLSRGFEFQVFS